VIVTLLTRPVAIVDFVKITIGIFSVLCKFPAIIYDIFTVKIIRIIAVFSTENNFTACGKNKMILGRQGLI
jgi:hypothetical protein